MEIDTSFFSLHEWHDWAGDHAFVYVHEHANRAAEKVNKAGFDDPFRLDRVTPSEIQPCIENLREGLYARGLTSRYRAVLRLIEQETAGLEPSSLRMYASEALSPFALRLRSIFPKFVGSEFTLSEQQKRDLYPVLHQDLTKLDLPDDTFDIVSTNEVLEHVHNLDVGLSELARVLRVGGWHIGTHPFRFVSPDSDVRARIQNGSIVHLKEKEIHGNPMDPEGGSLVFETPGWDIIERAKKAGFSRAFMRFISSERYGILSENMGVFVLCAQK